MTFTPKLVSNEGHEYPLAGTQVVGRDKDSDIRLESEKVSRNHARFTVTDDGVTVEDLGSSNGTRLNGMPISTPSSLMNGDKVEIDRFILTVQIALEDGDNADATVIGNISSEPQSAAATPADAALPGGWVESGTGESTEFFSPGGSKETVSVARHSDLAHLILLGPDGAVSEVFELESSSGDNEDAWELGRQSDCDIVLDDPTVSTRHAQLVHRQGRWRMVNLVSSNGIVINGEKRLTVYLDEGDTVQLGGSQLVFYADVKGAASGKTKGGERTARSAAESGSKSGSGPLLAGAVVILLILAAGALYLFKG